jgi:hypothetical protein
MELGLLTACEQFQDELQFHPDPACKLSAKVWHIPSLYVQWKTPERNCPKHVEFHSKNKFEKLVHLVGFITANITSTNSMYIMSSVNTYFLRIVHFSCYSVCVLRNLKCSSLKVGTEAWLLCCELYDSSCSVPNNMDQPLLSVEMWQILTWVESYTYLHLALWYLVQYLVHSAC